MTEPIHDSEALTESLVIARRRLAEERDSPCSSPGDVAYWESEVRRLDEQWRRDLADEIEMDLL